MLSRLLREPGIVVDSLCIYGDEIAEIIINYKTKANYKFKKTIPKQVSFSIFFDVDAIFETSKFCISYSFTDNCLTVFLR